MRMECGVYWHLRPCWSARLTLAVARGEADAIHACARAQHVSCMFVVASTGTRVTAVRRVRVRVVYVCLCVRLCLTVCRLWMCCVHARESHAEDTQHENGFREAAPAGGMPDAVGRHTVAAL